MTKASNTLSAKGSVADDARSLDAFMKLLGHFCRLSKEGRIIFLARVQKVIDKALS